MCWLCYKAKVDLIVKVKIGRITRKESILKLNIVLVKMSAKDFGSQKGIVQ